MLLTLSYRLGCVKLLESVLGIKLPFVMDSVRAQELDEGRFELRRGGVPCHLEPQVFEVLAYLVRNRGRLVSKAELLDEIWGSRFVTDSALASRVKAARRAVGDSGRDQRVDLGLADRRDLGVPDAQLARAAERLRVEVDRPRRLAGEVAQVEEATAADEAARHDLDQERLLVRLLPQQSAEPLHVLRDLRVGVLPGHGGILVAPEAWWARSNSGVRHS